ncbi:uncharacterized protein LOC110067535 [Orbicella faveolata]|uniref:uncharacterized protein LOC110067535 n=1 Tax=Orbicella faveolata TaxID=48498 RepID=UPI0009E46C40|nr:uncharacterized protein LOC110067535 [Orbicella faveolata]
MASNTQHLIFIYLLVCGMLSVGFELKHLKYCGPPNKTLKYKITPWPVLKPGQPVNITVSFTPGVDIFSSTLQSVIKNDGHIVSRAPLDIKCSKVPQICNLAAGGM